MPKFVIERDIPGAGKLTPSELKSISQKSCGVLSSLGPSVQWIHSYVTDDKIYCVYHAKGESHRARHDGHRSQHVGMTGCRRGCPRSSSEECHGRRYIAVDTGSDQGAI